MAKKKYIWVGKVNPKVKGLRHLKWRRSKHLRTEFQSYLDILLLSSVFSLIYSLYPPSIPCILLLSSVFSLIYYLYPPSIPCILLLASVSSFYPLYIHLLSPELSVYPLNTLYLCIPCILCIPWNPCILCIPPSPRILLSLNCALNPTP